MAKLPTDYELPEVGDRQTFKHAVLAAFRYPGTMRLCMSCRNHGLRYYGGKSNDHPDFYSKGWELCDRCSEALTILRPVEGHCHWYETTQKITTRHTPLVGVRQATYPLWPDAKNPNYEASGPIAS